MPENSKQTVINNGIISSSEIILKQLYYNDGQSENRTIQIYPITSKIEIGEIGEIDEQNSAG